MGSYSYARPTKMPWEDYFREEEGLGDKLVDCAVLGLRTAYLAMTDPKGRIYALVYTITPDMRSAAQLERNHFGMDQGWLKPLWEFSGPVRTKCPERILKLLTPLEEFEGDHHEKALEYAGGWRESCWKHQVERKRAREKSSQLGHGAIIKLHRPLRYPKKYGEADTYRLTKERTWRGGVRRRWMALDSETLQPRFPVRFRRGTLKADNYDIIDPGSGIREARGLA